MCLTLPLGSLAANADNDHRRRTPTRPRRGAGPARSQISRSSIRRTNTTSKFGLGEYVGHGSDCLGFKITPHGRPNYVGQDLTYTIIATNSGPSNATGVIVTDTLPRDITSNVTATTSVAGREPTRSLEDR